ncbi:MAG: hypothetical protein NC093_07050 [Alistipes sp.]|nr:hypothetical protein [Alistipes sp.]
MKKSILILIMTAMLTACVPIENPQETVEKSTEQAVTETSKYDEESEAETETQPSTEREISTEETTVTTSKTKSETVCTTTSVTDAQKEKGQYDSTETQQEKTAENPTDHAEPSAENAEEKSDVPVQTEPPQTTESTVTVTEPEKYEEETELPEYSMSDYEKALEVYNFMTANGGGTCVQYAWQTYEMCQNYGLECYFAWTENQLYGHVANVVKIDEAWYVLDTQAGCFLTENMCGFTEIVDANESYIASADIISSVRYE